MVELDLSKLENEDYVLKKVAEYLAEESAKDEYLAEACKKENKTLNGVMSYVESEAKNTIDKSKQKGNVCVHVDDSVVYGWAKHYILEDSLDFEKVNKAVPKTPARKVEKDTTESWKVVQPKPKYDINQLTFDF